jgi:transglutaminase-like putative cysteine protease
MKMKKIFLIIITCASLKAYGQDKSALKFGDISEKDFAQKVYAIDSNANAVVITDIGSSKMEGSSKGWFALVYKRFRRIHILNKNGYDAANVAINLYADGKDEESLDKLKAVTYNLENGKVVATKLDTKSGVFKDKMDNHRVIKKFTFPNVKEGSIIEYEYTITSDYLFNLQPWEFQGEYPTLWSEYKAAIPNFYKYVFLKQGYKGFTIDEVKPKREIFMIVDHKSQYKQDAMSLETEVSNFRWAIKDVPALKKESYTYTIANHITKIDFQLSEQVEPLQPERIMSSWPEVSKKLMAVKDFGLELTEDNYWLNDVVNSIVKDATTTKEKAQKIYTYLRDNYACTRNYGIFVEQNLRNVEKNKSGTVAEINLLLVAMLKVAGIATDPVILSTRSHGNTYYGYPVINQYNYVIARANIGGAFFLLDASQSRLGFGRLPLYAYNSFARVINPAADPIELKAIAVNEAKYTNVSVALDNKGNLNGTMQQTPGYYESFNIRNLIKEKGLVEFQKAVVTSFMGPRTTVTDFKIDSLDLYESNLFIKYNFDEKGENESILYVNPYFGQGLGDNPFKSAERVYPVEMPYSMDQTYTMQIEIPDGYTVDELPNTITLKLNDKGEGKFEYKISQSGSTISLRSRLVFTRSLFNPNEYQALRQLFDMVGKKQSEQIVFKKKK